MFAACLAALTVSCTKETGGNELAASRGTISVSVAGLMGEYTPETKSELVNTVRVKWVGDEIVYVYNEEEYLGYLTAAVDEDDRYAILSGTIKAPATEGKLYLVHSPLLTDESAAPELADGQLSISLAEQTTDRAPFVVFATLDYSGDAIEDVIVPFSFATSVIRVSCTGLKPNTGISRADISNMNTSCVLSFADGEVTPSGADEGIIARPKAAGFNNVNAEGDASFQFAVPALSSSSAGRTLTIKQGDDEYVDMKFSKASVDPNISVNTICSMVYMNNLIRGKFTVNAEGKQVYFSKGNLQATCNGSSYTWGFARNQYDIIGAGNEAIANPTEGTTLDLFGWSTATTYYGISTSNDFKDYKGDLVDWGRALGSNTWRTLSIDEWKYLIGTREVLGETGYGHTYTLATINGVRGIVLFCDDYIGPADDITTIPEDCVFLPEAGSRYPTDNPDGTRTQTKYEPNHLNYWSASPSVEIGSKNVMYVMCTFSDSEVPALIEWSSSSRNSGYAVRLVTDCN